MNKSKYVIYSWKRYRLFKLNDWSRMIAMRMIQTDFEFHWNIHQNAAHLW